MIDWDINWKIVKPMVSVRFSMDERRRLWKALIKDYPDLEFIGRHEYFLSHLASPKISSLMKRALFEKIERGEGL